MHPPSMYSFIFSKKFIPIFGIIVIVLFIFFYGIASTSPKAAPVAVVSPTPVPIVWKTDINTNNSYSMQYPADWTKGVNTIPTDQVKSFSFQEGGNTYSFTVTPPGQGHTEASLMHVDTVDITTINYGGRNFLRKLWIYNGKPFLIEAVPNEQGFQFNSFSMQLPTMNTDTYIAMFDQILSRLQFTGNLQPPVTPLPTEEGPRVIHIKQ